MDDISESDLIIGDVLDEINNITYEFDDPNIVKINIKFIK